MLKLKVIPRIARLLSGTPASHSTITSTTTRSFLFRSLSTEGGGGGGGGGNDDDADFFTQYLSQAPSPEEVSQQQSRRNPQQQQQSSSSSGYGRQQNSRYAYGGGRGGFSGRGGRFSPSRVHLDEDDVHLGAPITEEDLKLKQELDQKRARAELEEKKGEAGEEEEEEEEEAKSIYAGFIDPRYDDVVKLNKMDLKRLQYKDKAIIPGRFADEENEEDLSYLDKDSDDEQARGNARGGRGRGRPMGLEAAVEEGDNTDDEVDEEEWEIMNEMDNEEFENHLRHRDHAKQLRKEYDARILALGDKVEDVEEVRKVQKLIMKKWRAHYLMPRMVTPKEKEEMWQKHNENPEEWTVEKLAEEYNVCKARVHAILFLWDIRKHEGETQTAEEETKIYMENLCFDEWGKPCLPPHMGEDKWVTTWNTRPNYKIMPADWEGSVRSEEEAIEEASAKEEAMMLEEFMRRLEFNKLQMAGLMKQNKHDRRRPPGGWTYLIEKLGPEGKRGKRGGFRFVATSDGKHRKLNDLEKLVLKREAVRPRKRIL